MFVFVIQIVIITLIVYFIVRKKNPLDDIPGPKPYPIIGNVHQLDAEKVFINLWDFAKQDGGIFKLYFFNKPVIIVNDQHLIHDVLGKQSTDFAGRPRTYRMELMSENFNEIVFTDIGPTHSERKKVLLTYLKKFGSGIKKLEDVTQTATDDLITRFVQQHGSPIFVEDFMFNCVTDILAILLTGEMLSPEGNKDIKTLMDDDMKVLGRGSGLFLDWFPFLRFFGNQTYNTIQENLRRRNNIMNEWFEKRPDEGLINFMQSMTDEERRASFFDTTTAQTTTAYVFFSVDNSNHFDLSDECAVPSS